MKNFFCKYWRAVAWTAFYIFIMWLVLDCLFGFNMFSVAHLVRLRSVQLHGFPGLVFGLLILAAVPLYIATTVLTVRKKSLPIKIPLPKCFEPLPPPAEPAPPVPIVTEQEALPQVRPGVPAEMRENFMRAQKNYGSRQMSVFNKPMTSAVPVAAGDSNSGDVPVTESGVSDVVDTPFPIPTDFDISSDDSNYGVPVFSDVNFDDEADTDSETKSPIDDLCEFLVGSGYKVDKTDNDLIIVGDCAIAVHDDDDFWVTDDIDWFASGRQKPSPIVALVAARDEGGKKPILYLGEHNIMDYEKVSMDWADQGITIVTSQDDLLKAVSETN